MTRLVLFDLDGTFVDTADDLIETANTIYLDNNKSKITYEIGREVASNGIKAFLKLRFNENTDNFDLLTDQFLKLYNENFLNSPSLFDGINSLLIGLENNGIKWGIVTNKARYFAENIIKHHNLFIFSYDFGNDDNYKRKLRARPFTFLICPFSRFPSQRFLGENAIHPFTF